MHTAHHCTPQGQDMNSTLFDTYFQGQGQHLLRAGIALALEEDGPDRTAQGVFAPNTLVRASIIAKQDTLVVGLPLIPLIFEEYGTHAQWHALVHEGACVCAGTEVARIAGSATDVLTLERILLNYIAHLSGIAQLVRRYVGALQGTGTRLLDTRKTLPGLRWPEKYAVRMGGGHNHRMSLGDMLMLKDTHIDASDGIVPAVARLRAAYTPCPPIVVECRTCEDVDQAVGACADRILLDNMDMPTLARALPRIPPAIEAEVSGNVTLDNIRALALVSPRRPEYISVGRLTHSAPSADFSMRIVSP